MTDLVDLIDKLGEELTSCEANCEGVDNNAVPPRGIFLENPKNMKSLDCIIIGQNPGGASDKEKEEYRKHRTYVTTKKLSTICIVGEPMHPYYKRARRFAEELDWGRSILWTELCKCQSASVTINGKKTKKQIPLQTYRNCIKRFLERELEKFPNTPIITLGREAFTAVSYRFPNRFIIGIPHPTGARGNKFFSLFRNDDPVNGKLKKQYKKKIANAKEHECVMVFPENPKA